MSRGHIFPHCVTNMHMQLPLCLRAWQLYISQGLSLTLTGPLTSILQLPYASICRQNCMKAQLCELIIQDWSIIDKNFSLDIEIIYLRIGTCKYFSKKGKTTRDMMVQRRKSVSRQPRMKWHESQTLQANYSILEHLRTKIFRRLWDNISES